jgi:pyridoxamine 5'-phosphate oxidase
MRRDLDAVLEHIWAMLARGVKCRHDPFRTAVLGTVLGPACRQRTVILRHIDRPSRLLTCHGDARSDKVTEINTVPRTAWLFYHPRRRTQVRITGDSTVHTDDEIAHREWASTTSRTRREYVCEPPGTARHRPAPARPKAVLACRLTPAETECARRNFAAIRTRVESIDWLKLGLTGHLRARFTWDADGHVRSTWLAP